MCQMLPGMEVRSSRKRMSRLPFPGPGHLKPLFSIATTGCNWSPTAAPFSASISYGFGISRGVVKPFAIAWKAEVNCLMAELVGDVATQLSASSE